VTRATLDLAVSLLLCGARGLRAQSAKRPPGGGVASVSGVGYERARLCSSGAWHAIGAGLADSLRGRALTYLAATELFRDSAIPRAPRSVS